MKSWKGFKIKQVCHAEFISESNQFAHTGKILKQVQDDGKKKSFTLAEVLITLGIIGIVAAMTIPTLMQNTQNAELVTKMKKEYSVLSNAFEQLKTESGGDFTFALANGTSSGNSLFRNIFESKISYVKECSTASTDGCLSNNIKLPGSGLTDSMAGAYTNPGIISKDGASLIFHLDDMACKQPRNPYPNGCGWVLVDVNGPQSPNIWGRDVYLFFIFSDVIRPYSAKLNAGTDDCTNTSYGYTCAGKYLLGN